MKKGYDAFDRVTSMQFADSSNLNTTLESHAYTYDKNSNILTEIYINNYPQTQSEKVNETRTYTYDNLNRLKTSKITNNTNNTEKNTSYTYDKVGNCTQIVEDGVTTTNTYNAFNQMTQSTVTNGNTTIEQTTYSYNAQGCQTSSRTRNGSSVLTGKTFKTYDASNRMTSMTGMDGNSNILYEQENTYTTDGKRVSRTDDGDETNFFYQGDVLLYTTDENGDKLFQNIIGPRNNIIATIHYDNGQHAHFYNKDIRTSVTNIVDESGNGVVSYKYDDYGNTNKYGNTGFYNEICYTSGVYDETTGLYYLNARYYDPNGRIFTTQDSYRVGNLYGYCNGDPISNIDPSGNSSVVVSGGIYKDEKSWYYEFIEPALKQLIEWSSFNDKKYWLIADNGWTKSDRARFRNYAKSIGNVKIIRFKSSEKFIKILNNKRFKKDPITDFTVFSHGVTGKLAFGFDYSYDSQDDKYDLDFRINQIKKIRKSHLMHARSRFYSCNSATKISKGKKSFAERWSRRFWSTTTAYKGKTDYSGIRGTWYERNYIYKIHPGAKITPAIYYPTKGNDAVKKTFKKYYYTQG